MERSLVDYRRARHAYRLILRTGAPGTANGADDLAVFNDRNAATPGDHIIDTKKVLEIEVLHGVFKSLGWTAECGSRAGLVLGNGDWASPRARARLISS